VTFGSCTLECILEKQYRAATFIKPRSPRQETMGISRMNRSFFLLCSCENGEELLEYPWLFRLTCSFAGKGHKVCGWVQNGGSDQGSKDRQEPES